MKPTILYVIDSLMRGGAEMMLVSPLRQVHQQYNVIIVTLTPGNSFSKEELSCDKICCLDVSSKIEIFLAVRKLKKIIRENNVSIVHSFLYWSSIAARLACGKKIPYVCSLATVMSAGVYKLKWYSGYTLLLEKYTYQKNHFIISPTKEVLDDFVKCSGANGRSRVIPNFVNEPFFGHPADHQQRSGNLRLVAVGNLKDVKNYQLMIEAFKLLKGYPVSLDIYGHGPEKESLQKQITLYALPMELKGSNSKIYEALPEYDGYVMCSYIEGFGISAAEAMAIGLPLLLSDLKVLREVSHNNALFFDPFSPGDFVTVIKDILQERTNLHELSTKAKRIAKKYYTKKYYLHELFKVYKEVLTNEPIKKINVT